MCKVLNARQVGRRPALDRVYVGRPSKWGNPVRHRPRRLARRGHQRIPRIDRVVAGTHGGAARTARQRSRVRPSAATATCSSNSQTTDADFGIRTDTAWRLWRPVTGRRHGRPPDQLTRQRRYRLGLALRALDARLAGASYRVIAAGLFSDAYIRAVAAGKRMICATGPFAWSAPARS